MAEHIDILLATYNGGTFLDEQLRSILAQSHRDWHVLVRDDGSRDSTLAILQKFERLHPGRITVLQDYRGNLGSVGNFSALLAASNAPYMALCDQDDVWHPEKLELGLAAVKQLEENWGATTPCLSFSDLTVVDAALAPIAKSFWRHENIDPRRANYLSHTLTQNVVTGCTAILNRSLAKLAAPVPPEAILHDWWIALTAAAFGHIVAIPRATILYRQHGRNELGARGYTRLILRRVRILFASGGHDRPGYLGLVPQARAFRNQFAQRLDPADRTVIDGFIALADQSLPNRAIAAWQGGYLPTGLARATGFVVFLESNGK